MSEVTIKLLNGNIIKSGCSTPDFISGEYVQLCNSEGKEIAYWDHSEWQEDPILVMGAILNSAAGFYINTIKRLNE